VFNITSQVADETTGMRALKALPAAKASKPPAAIGGLRAKSRAKRVMDTRDESFYYEGFIKDIGTVVPDDVFDVLAPRLKESELRVLLYIVRHTFGWRKYSDAISLSQLTNGIRKRDGRIRDLGTGMSRKAVIAGVKGLVEKGIITVRKGRNERGDRMVNVYDIRFRQGADTQVTEGNHRSDRTTPPPVTEVDQGSNPEPLPPVTEGNPQETSLQDTDIQDATDNNSTVAAISSASDKRLYDDLRSIGIQQHTAATVVRDYPPTRVNEMLQYLIYRLQGGWRPRQSPAAWLIAALRDDYTIPQYEKTNAPDQSTLSPARLAAASARRTAELERKLAIQRKILLEDYGVEQDVENMWQRARQRLRDLNQGSPVLAAAVLRITAPDKAELLVPRPMLERIKEDAATIQAAVEAEVDRSIGLTIKPLR
jgi:hypothetical protein